jgi:hypothetical protein
MDEVWVEGCAFLFDKQILCYEGKMLPGPHFIIPAAWEGKSHCPISQVQHWMYKSHL